MATHTIDRLVDANGDEFVFSDSQNAFSNVKVGSTTVAADSKADTLELASSSAITLTPDAANDKVTIGVSTMGAASSSAAGTAGIVPAPGAGKQASFLRGDGTWVVPTNTDTLVKATAKTDNVNYKILATASASPTSGNATEAVYDTDISLNPSTNTITSNISGNAATATKPAVTTLTASDKLNNVGGSTAGDVLWYKWASGNAPANVPIAVAAVMEVVRTHGDKHITQTVYTADHGIYRRDCIYGTWSSWYKYSKTTHTHGNITSDGALQTTDVAIANGDKLVVTDSSDSSKVARASISFDGSTTTQALTKAGTWATFNNYSHPAGSAPSKTGVPTANATPGFGGTFKVNQITTDATSHVSAVTERTITIPNATATTSADGLMSTADKQKLDGIATGAEANVQADWNSTDSSSDTFIKNKPYFTMYIGSPGIKFKVCTVVKYDSSGTGSDGIEVFYRRGSGAVHGYLLHKATFELYLERIGDVSTNTHTLKFYYVENSTNVDIYAESDSYCRLTAAPLANIQKDRIDFTNFGTNVDSIPEGAVAINPVWVANSSASSGTAPVKVNAFGDLTPVPMDSIPTASSTNLMTSGDIKTALDNAVANVNMRYPFGVRQNRTTSYGYRLFNVKFSTAKSATNVRISGNIVVGTTGYNEHISFDLVIANVNTVENNPSSINLITTSTRRDSRVVRLAYKRPSNWDDGLDVFILWNAEGTATAANYTYGWEIIQQEATRPRGVEVKDENLTSALTGFTLDSPRTFAITEGTSAIGSTSVPVYANANGVITPCTDDFVHDGDVTSTYSSTGTAPVNGTAITAAINALDVSSVGGDGKYISAISETDGKISATATTMDTTPTAGSTNPVTSEGIKTALEVLQSNIDTADAKGIVINEINGENVICFE